MRLWKFGILAVLAGLLTQSVRRRRKGAEQFDLSADEGSRVEDAGRDSFPASDAPSWTLGEERRR